jgi:prolipoprotein diacylglyceryltransferase
VLAHYVMAYTLGRGWIETLRIDNVQLNDVLGLRLNVWTSIVLFALASAYFFWAGRKGLGREESVYHKPPLADDAGESSDSSAV